MRWNQGPLRSRPPPPEQGPRRVRTRASQRFGCGAVTCLLPGCPQKSDPEHYIAERGWRASFLKK